MEKKQIFTIALVSALVAVLVVVTLKLAGYDNPTVIGGGVAGGVAGGIVSSFLKKKNGE